MEEHHQNMRSKMCIRDRVTQMLHLLTEAGVDIIKTENLYLFDGVRGFSLGQGE